MNKIHIQNNRIIKKQVSSAIVLTWEQTQIPKLQLDILRNTQLEVVIDSDDTKIEMQVTVEPNVECTIEMENKSQKSKILTHYLVKQNSTLKLIKLNDIDVTNERDIIDLKEEYASLDYILKTACTNKEKYNVTVNHLAKNTTSSILNHGINLDKGTITMDVSTSILEGMKGSTANQNSRIINLTNQECMIRPNLLIDEQDVIANHSAHIGSLKDEELFYLERLGIPYNDAVKLLLQGFMKSSVDEKKITKIFEKYWR